MPRKTRNLEKGKEYYVECEFGFTKMTYLGKSIDCHVFADGEGDNRQYVLMEDKLMIETRNPSQEFNFPTAFRYKQSTKDVPQFYPKRIIRYLPNVLRSNLSLILEDVGEKI